MTIENRETDYLVSNIATIKPGSRFRRWLHYALFIIHYSLFFLACTNDRTSEAAQFFLKGNEQLQQREYKEAIRFYTEAIQQKPDFADAYNNRGLARFRNDDRAGAVADYTKSIETDPDFGAAYLNRAEVLLETGDAAGSLTDLQRIEKQYRDSSFYQTRLGDANTRLHNTGQAQSAYDRALQLNPANVEALTNRGALLFSQQAYKLAGDDIRRALQLNPNQDAALNNMSLLLAQASFYGEALPYVERALTIQPAQPYYLNNKAYLLLKLNRPTEVLPLVQESLRLNGENAWAYRTLGLYYLSQKQSAQALAALRQAEKVDASVDQLYFYIGTAERANGNQGAACEAWQRGASAGDKQAKAARATYCR